MTIKTAIKLHTQLPILLEEEEPDWGALANGSPAPASGFRVGFVTVDSVDVVFGRLDVELGSVVGAGALSDVVGLDKGELLGGVDAGVCAGVGVDWLGLSSVVVVDLCPVGVDLVAVFFVGDGDDGEGRARLVALALGWLYLYLGVCQSGAQEEPNSIVRVVK
ncbi:hypothetical protein NQ176_g7993 [Zarea fungicola]|uniref:Uncharacterized protein n=1 Tax=Zarea fungicola TaxID=93591 RepID=A0ACC1MW04_9HYPO|nr:hypothetical protein NQ176_g7993 [Lecanicillium fungicola]